MNTAIVTPEVLHVRTARQQYWDGFDLYVRCHFGGEWPQADEIAAMSVSERKGYNSAADAQAEAEYAEYRLNVNAFGDYSQGGGF